MEFLSSPAVIHVLKLVALVAGVVALGGGGLLAGVRAWQRRRDEERQTPRWEAYMAWLRDGSATVEELRAMRVWRESGLATELGASKLGTGRLVAEQQLKLQAERRDLQRRLDTERKRNKRQAEGLKQLNRLVDDMAEEVGEVEARGCQRCRARLAGVRERRDRPDAGARSAQERLSARQDLADLVFVGLPRTTTGPLKFSHGGGEGPRDS